MSPFASILLASIPSPSSGALDLGPLTIHMYGLTLLAAIAVCIWITGHRCVNRGGDWDLIFRCAVWGVGAGHRRGAALPPRDELERGARPVVGAVRDLEGRARRLGRDRPRLPRRRHHREARGRRRRGSSPTASRPGLLVAQAVGRIGNWWNQELYGKATDLPWGLEIDPAHRPLASLDQATYHPTFLYELLWNLFAAALLVFVIERRFHPRPPGLFALYIALYSFGRFWIELLRVDPANHILGLRVNTWVSGLVCVAGVVWFVLSQRAWRGRSRSAARRRRRPGRRWPCRRAASDPGARVRSWPVPSAISSWTSTPSRGRSTSS